mmetsp:Transcript_16846/g.24995  ORF Transcript_16846/g.24995 Transcript_16846/m.24995 type:complete len:80 (-) Transcript_16846:48-287(-)
MRMHHEPSGLLLLPFFLRSRAEAPSIGSLSSSTVTNMFCLDGRRIEKKNSDHEGYEKISSENNEACMQLYGCSNRSKGG